MDNGRTYNKGFSTSGGVTSNEQLCLIRKVVPLTGSWEPPACAKPQTVMCKPMESENFIERDYYEKPKNILRFMKQYLFFLFILVPLLLSAQSTDYNNLDKWESICFCSYSTFHPATIVRADNNWQLLYTLRNGLSLTQLDSLNIPYTQSQLLLLRSQRLLRRSQNIYKAVIPIFDYERTLSLRKLSLSVANSIYPEIEKECSELVAHLSQQNRSSNAFSILFSYVLDGLSWERFERDELVVERDGSEIWSGYYWFLTPKRTFQCGTNSLISGGIEFSSNWSDVESVTDNLFNNDIKALIQSLRSNNHSLDRKLFDEFSVYGFFNQDSTLTIPVINEKETNTLCHLSNEIMDKLLPAFLEKASIETLKTLYQFNDTSEAIVIFYHEVMWDIMDLLLQKEVIQLPTAFQFPERAKPTDAAELCFIVIRENE
jgi:hypothetical protein